MAENLSLNINVDILKKLDEADKKLQQIATHSEEVSKAMKKLSTDGINSVVNSLTQMNTTLTKLAQNNSLANVGTQANQSVDAINKMIAALAQLTNQQQLRLQTQQAKLDYKKEANDIKELAVAENERSRALDRQNKANAANDKHRQALETKRLANDTKELMNIEQERGRQLVLQNQKNIAAYTKQSVKLKQQINEINRLAKAYQQMPTKLKQVDLNKIITSASKAKTINQHIVAIHNLKNALRDLDTTSKNYKNNVNRINAEIRRNQNELNKLGVNVDRVKNKKRKLMDTVGQLQRKLSLLFSVSQIVGYFNKMVAIRKEMEMQQKSLQVLLQNKDEADKLWNQVIDLAVKSPFRVKQLVTYTKQLAAYRIESDQLFDTTKRLSDVSAGLGVDMQRLILAYGQIRAAGFLRGTELRQLTEAGLPMLDELSKYLTEVEGRAIRTGDVFEMISKRMVSFKDVQEVFKRMTSEGGVFFNMQEEQAKTLAGSISNLHDSIDLMLNDIGKANDATLKGTIASVRSLVENWREVAAALKFVLTISSPFLAFWGLAKIATSSFGKSLYALSLQIPALNRGLYTIQSTIAHWGRSSKIAAAAANVLTKALGGLATIGVGFAIYAISEAIISLYLSTTKASREAKELKKNLDAIILEDATNLEKQVDGFKDLSTRLGDANEGSQERREIISALNNQYGEYLDFVVDEKTSMDELANSYDEVVKKMKEKAALASFEKGIQAINDSYGRQLEDATEFFYDLFEGASIKKSGDDWGLSSIVPTQKEIDDIFNLVQQRIREADKESIDSLQEQQELLQQIIADYYGEEFYLSRDYGKSIELIDIMIRRKEEEEKLQKRINQEYKETLKSKEANLAFEKLQNDYAQKQKAIRNTKLSKFETNKQLQAAKQQFELDKIDIKLQFGEISEESAKAAKDKIINWASETVAAVNEQIRTELSSSFTEEEYSQILISQEEYGKGMSAILKNTVDNYELHNQLLMDEISLKDAGKQFDEKKIQYYERLLELDKFRAKALGIELDLVQKIDQESVKSINSQLDPKYQISLEDSYKSVLQIQEEANKKRQDAIKLEAALLLQREKGVAISESTLQQVQADAAGWTKLWELSGGAEKEKKTTTRHNSLYDERIKVIDDMNKKYKELNKKLEKSEALQGAFDAYIDAFATAYKGINWVPSNVRSMSPQEFASKVLNFPDENSLVDFLDRLSKEPMKTFEKIKVELAKGEYVYDIKTRIKAEDDKELLEQIEDMFSGYEMSIELQKMNIPSDLAKKLFNIDSLTLPDLRDKIKSMESQFIGTEMEKEYREFLKKIDEMEDKEQKERLKKYVKYMLQAQSERVKIKFDEMNQLSEIEKLNVSELDKNIMRQGVREETQKKLDKAAWEDFKNSDMYIRIFEDLDRASSKALSAMQDKLVELRGSLSELSPENLKEIVRLEEKFAKAKIDKNPFAGLITSMKNLKSARKELNKLEEEHGFTYEEGIKTYEEQRKKIDEIQIYIKKLTDAYGADTPNAVFEKEYLETLKKANKELAYILEKMGLLNSQATNSKNGIEDSFSGMSNIFSQAAQSTNEIADALDKMGALGDAQKDNFETIAGIFGGMSGIMSGAEKMASGNPFAMVAGGIQALGGIASIVGEIFAIGDKKKERQIQREIKLVEDLEREYEKFGKAIDNAYSINTLQTSGKAAKDNLEAQIDSYEKMIAAEDDKKKKDEDRIKEWQLAIEDLNEQKAELDKQLVSTATGGVMDDVLSAAQEFTDAWLEAFNETGDGLSGLESNFKETMLEMVKQQAAMLISSAYIEKWKKQLEEYINPNDLELSTDEAKKWVDAVTTSLPQLNQALENYFTAMQQAGVDLSGGQGELSGLQRGIQGVTEETAQIIEAYLNSIRFFVAEQNTYLSQIAASFSNTEIENPMVEQLRIIATQTSAINSLLQGLVRGGHTLGGSGLKVFIS